MVGEICGGSWPRWLPRRILPFRSLQILGDGLEVGTGTGYPFISRKSCTLPRYVPSKRYASPFSKSIAPDLRTGPMYSLKREVHPSVELLLIGWPPR